MTSLLKPSQAWHSWLPYAANGIEEYARPFLTLDDAAPGE